MTTLEHVYVVSRGDLGIVCICSTFESARSEAKDLADLYEDVHEVVGGVTGTTYFVSEYDGILFVVERKPLGP